jgi:organic hydroperoxide reductase OsmC/OhrA
MASIVQRERAGRGDASAGKERPMASPFPHHYDVRLYGGSEGAVLAADHRPEIVGGAPPEFDGRAEWWSPEHLLLSSVGLCLMTTFQAFARRARLHVAGYESRVEGVLDKTAAGLGFTTIRLKVELRVPEEDRARAEQLLQSAKRHCIVANALKLGVELEAEVKAA